MLKFFFFELNIINKWKYINLYVIIMKKYNVLGVIGDGAFGTVRKATNSQSTEHMIVAIKQLKEPYTDWKLCMKSPEIQALM